MQDILSKVTDSSAFYAPHGFCFDWDPWITGMLIIGNLMTAIAYVWIPIQLLSLAFSQVDIKTSMFSNSRTVKFILSSFILSCAVHHTFEVIILFRPWYYTMGIIDVVTGIISLTSAIAIKEFRDISPNV